VQEAAWRGHEENRLHLMQRRLGPPVTGKYRDAAGNLVMEVNWNTGLGPGFEYIAYGKSFKSKKREKKGKDKGVSNVFDIKEVMGAW